MPFEGEHARIRNPAVRVAKGTLRDVRADGARNQRRQPRADHAPAQQVDGHGVADEVDDVHDEGGEHRRARIADAAQERAVGIVNRHDGVGERRHEEVRLTCCHHLILDIAEEGQQQRLAENQANRHNRQRNEQNDVEQHLRGSFRGIRALLPQILADQHCAARRQGGEHANQQHVDAVHQRNAAHRLHAAVGHHDGIHHANQHDEKLLRQERQKQLLQVLFGENHLGFSRREFFRGSTEETHGNLLKEIRNAEFGMRSNSRANCA